MAGRYVARMIADPAAEIEFVGLETGTGSPFLSLSGTEEYAKKFTSKMGKTAPGGRMLKIQVPEEDGS